MSDLNAILNCNAAQHHYLFVIKDKKGNETLETKKIGLLGRIGMWLHTRFHINSASMIRVMQYIEKNHQKIFQGSIRNCDSIQFNAFIKKVKTYGFRHPLNNLHLRVVTILEKALLPAKVDIGIQTDSKLIPSIDLPQIESNEELYNLLAQKTQDEENSSKLTTSALNSISDENIKELLEMSIEFKNIKLFRNLWNAAPEHIKFNKLSNNKAEWFEIFDEVCRLEKSDIRNEIVSIIFTGASVKDQALILIGLLKLKDDGLFKILWSSASKELKIYQYQDKPWIFHALYEFNEPICSILREEFIQVITDGATPLDTLRRLINSNMFACGKKTIQEFEQSDGGFTKDIEICKVFGHAFSLEGPLFAGISRYSNGCTLENSLMAYLNSTFEKTSGCEAMIQALKIHNGDNLDAIFAQAVTKWAIVACRWSNHAAKIIFTPTMCIKIETGAGEIESRGIKFYKICNKDPVALKKAIKKILSIRDEGKKYEENCEYFEKTIDTELNLKFLTKIKKTQTSGNCAWMSLKMSVLTIFVLIEQQKKNCTLDKAYNNIKDQFELWDYFDRLNKLKDADAIMRKYPHIYDLPKVYSELIKKCILEGQYRIIGDLLELEPKLINWQDETGKSLLRVALEKSFYLFMNLIKTGADLNLKDKNSKSLKDDLIKEGLSSEKIQIFDTFLVTLNNDIKTIKSLKGNDANKGGLMHKTLITKTSAQLEKHKANMIAFGDLLAETYKAPATVNNEPIIYCLMHEINF